MCSWSIKQVASDEDTNRADGILSQLCLPTCSGCLPPAALLRDIPALWIPGSVDPVGTRAPELILSTHRHWQGQPGWSHTCSSPSQPDTGKPPGKKAGRWTCDLLPSSQPCQDPKAQGT